MKPKKNTYSCSCGSLTIHSEHINDMWRRAEDGDEGALEMAMSWLWRGSQPANLKKKMNYHSHISDYGKRDHHVPSTIFAIMVIVCIVLLISSLALSVVSNDLDMQRRELELRVNDLENQNHELRETIYEMLNTPTEESLESLSVVERGHTAVVTAYTHTGNKNAAGRMPRVGEVACPRAIDLGTRVKIDGIVYTCADRTAKKYNGRYDRFVETHDEAVKWGRQEIIVEVL